MNGDGKSPQHTAVHPIYVSYSSIPTSATATMTSKISNNNLGVVKAFNTSSSNTNTLSSLQNRNSISSYGNRSDLRYAVVSTEKLIDDHEPPASDRHGEMIILNNIKTKNLLLHENLGYIPQIRPNKIHGYHNPYDDDDEEDSNNLNCSSGNIPSIKMQATAVHHPFYSENGIETENYKMPLQYITRSPNLNRNSSRRRNDKPIVNFCDKIRDAPPGYTEMQRAKSQDRLSYRNRQRSRNNNNLSDSNSRPRSFCSNTAFPEEVTFQ